MVVTMKKCPKCKTEKPLTEFWKNKAMTDGFQCWCKDCWKVITTARRNGPNREVELRQRRNRHIVNKYGITIDEYESILNEQGGVCAICKQKNPTKIREMALDHNHDTGQVRGILCENCNRGLGLFKENQEYLNSAIEYLGRWW